MTRPLSMDIRDRAMARLVLGGTLRRRWALPRPAWSSGHSAGGHWGLRLLARSVGMFRPRSGARSSGLAADPDGAARFTLRGLVAELAEAGPGRGLRARTAGADCGWTIIRCGTLPMSRVSALEKTALASEQDKLDIGPDVARKRAGWKQHQGTMDLQRPVFIDVEAGQGIDPGDRYPAEGGT